MFAALAFSLCADASAQMYKCRDAAGKITYSSQECAEIGLKPGGEVPERITVTPAYQPPPAPAATRPVPPRAGEKRDSPASQVPEPERKADPERCCFTVKTAKGTATHCNDKPEEDARK
jgi:hypothetical protein